MATTTRTKRVKSLSHFANTPKGQHDRWTSEIALAEKKLEKWKQRARKTNKRFLDERDAKTSGLSFANLYNTNIGIWIAALYARLPKPDVGRRFKDSGDDVARVGGEIIERCLITELDLDHYADITLKNVIQDYCVVGLGCAWVRYDADKQVDDSLTMDENELSEEAPEFEVDEYGNLVATDAPEEVEQEITITGESTPIEYVNWNDFLWQPARTWNEVEWVAKRVYMDFDAITEKWGEEVAERICNGNKDEDDIKTDDDLQLVQRAEVWEIWNKPDKQVYFYSKSAGEILEVMDDFLSLPKFFPTPKPLLTNVSTSSLEPIPDYYFAQDQYDQLNDIVHRIYEVSQTIRVAGVFDAKEGALADLFNGTDGVMFPVAKWEAFSEKGGIGGSVQFVDVEKPAKVLRELMSLAESLERSINKITGISDIQRGQADPYVTGAATQLAASSGGQRVQARQRAIAEYCSELMEMKASLMCSHYEPESLIKQIGKLPDVDMALVPEAIEFIQDENIRHYRVKVSVDSLTMPDAQAEAGQRNEFIQSITQYMAQVLPAVKQTPEVGPLALEMLKYGVAGRPHSASIEGVIDDGLRQLSEAAANEKANPQPKKPSEGEQKLQIEQMKIEADQQNTQAKMAADQERAKDQLALDQSRAAQQFQIEQMKAEADVRKSDMDLQFQREKLSLEQAKIELEVQKLGLERDRLKMDNFRSYVDAKTKAAVPSAVDVDGLAQSFNVPLDPNNPDEVPAGALGEDFSSIVKAEQEKHISKDDFLMAVQAMNENVDARMQIIQAQAAQAAAQAAQAAADAQMAQAALLQQMAGIANALNTLATTPLPESHFEFTTPEGERITGTIQ